jgi:hypothetical protein
MKIIYQVYEYSTGKSSFFSTKKKADVYIKECWQENVQGLDEEELKDKANSLKSFIENQGFEIIEVELL